MPIMQSVKIIISYLQLLAIILSVLVVTLCPIFGNLFYTKISLLLKAVNCNCKDPVPYL
jgi:hypothetical protein